MSAATIEQETAMPDLDHDELAPSANDRENAGCVECGRDWYGQEADACPDCVKAGGAPGACFQCAELMRWNRDHEAECDGSGGCDAVYPLAVVRTYRLGQLVERLVAESRTGSAEEVGRMILAAGRNGMRRVQ